MDGESEEVGRRWEKVGGLGRNAGSVWIGTLCFRKTPLLADSLSFLCPYASCLFFPPLWASVVFSSQLLTFMMNCNPMQFSKGFIFIYTFWVISKHIQCKIQDRNGHTVTMWSPLDSLSLLMIYCIFFRDSVNTYTLHIHTVLHIAPPPYSAIWFGNGAILVRTEPTAKTGQNPTYRFTILYKSHVEGHLLGCQPLAVVIYPVDVSWDTCTLCWKNKLLEQGIPD